MTARLTLSLVSAALLALAGTSAFAQHGQAPAAKPAPAPAPATEAAVDPTSGVLVETAPAAPGKDAKIEHLVSEDSQVKIEETRVRGITKKIVVHSKITGGSYEIQPKDPSRAPDQDHGAGMRTFSFGF
ncbi:MAG: hypothetical protein JF585_02505 [Burkholderiales bacterium]|jgi:hypothetical protein|nr:hypothetical protein [Burkholderiales bacterium]